MNKAYTIVNEYLWTKKHQTLTVIVIDDISEKFQERSNRFITSLNRKDTIKSDVFLLSNGNFIHIDDGNSWRDYVDNLFVIKENTRNSSMIKDFARSCGYAQVCVIESTNL